VKPAGRAKINQPKSKAGHGGKRENAGRKPGSANRVTVLISGSLAATAKAYTASAIGTLVAIMGDARLPAAARVISATALLDRGWGRPVQSHEHAGRDGGPIETREYTDLEAARRVAFLLTLAAAAAADPSPALAAGGEGEEEHT
jgi:hypothetical protein